MGNSFCWYYECHQQSLFSLLSFIVHELLGNCRSNELLFNQCIKTFVFFIDFKQRFMCVFRSILVKIYRVNALAKSMQKHAPRRNEFAYWDWQLSAFQSVLVSDDNHCITNVTGLSKILTTFGNLYLFFARFASFFTWHMYSIEREIAVSVAYFSIQFLLVLCPVPLSKWMSMHCPKMPIYCFFFVCSC